MSSGSRVGLALLAVALLSTPAKPSAARQDRAAGRPSDFDIRDGGPGVHVLEVAAASRLQPNARERRLRLNRDSDSVRLLDDSDLSTSRTNSIVGIRALLVSNAHQLNLQGRDLSTLVPIRDYVSRSNGVRHVFFAQVIDGHPVFDSSIGVHLRPDGTVLRITSNAAPIDNRNASPTVSRNSARTEAATHAAGTPAGEGSLVWLPVNNQLRLGWHNTVSRSDGDVYDVLTDAHSGELLLRRSRVRFAEGSGRFLQSPTAWMFDPRRPDRMPFGVDGMPACPPPVNFNVHSLTAPFRDSATVLGSTGRLEGNNVRISRGTTSLPGATGTLVNGAWIFDFPFNSPGSSETSLFFAMNFTHDFFYDLGFDEAAGNFQVDNFGRGGLGGDPVRATARAQGRNNSNYVHAPDGTSPSINMFLFDGSGCWGEDVNGDGTSDLDGDYDLDIVVHEFHHGVSLRLNTAFTGNEAGAIGEGGGDFFAYSVNNEPTLAEYAWPGGLRRVNGKSYADWSCLLGIFCEVHDNGEIWANVLWDVRERFRTDLVRGTEGTAINEAHQLYIDALTLSPPSPTMLDMRDAMLQADMLRNPAGPTSANFCRLWESFAARGMGQSATDTADNGFNRVGPAYDVPAGCNAPPSPPVVTIATTTATAYEAGTVPAAVTISRGVVTDRALNVNYQPGGTATPGTDYVTLSRVATIPAGAADVTIPIVPIDDTLVESNETVSISLATGSGYIVGTPASATVTIVSDDVAPDLVVSALTAPRAAESGATIQVTDTIRNQGAGAADPTQTRYYLSRNALLDASDTPLGSRAVPVLAPGATNADTVSVTLPGSLDAGTYYVIAKADGGDAIVESSEINNTRGVSFAVGPDLVVSTLTAPTMAAAGGSIVVTDTTANQGAGTAGTSWTRFYLSSNVFFDASDIPLQTRNVPELTTGASSTGPTTLIIPAGTAAGTYYLFAQADSTAAVMEPNESNNTRSTSIRIGPDLTVFNLIAPTRAASGATIVVTDAIKNTGAATASPSSTAFYISANLTLDATDIRLQPTRAVPALGLNEVSTGSTSITLPQLAPGTWYLLAKADDANDVAEVQEGNNVRFMTIQIITGSD